MIGYEILHTAVVLYGFLALGVLAIGIVLKTAMNGSHAWEYR